MTEILTKREKTAALRERGKALKPKLKLIKGWKIDFCEKHPGYNTVQWGMIIQNVIIGATVDKELIEALEAYIEANQVK